MCEGGGEAGLKMKTGLAVESENGLIRYSIPIITRMNLKKNDVWLRFGRKWILTEIMVGRTAKKEKVLEVIKPYLEYHGLLLMNNGKIK